MATTKTNDIRQEGNFFDEELGKSRESYETSEHDGTAHNSPYRNSPLGTEVLSASESRMKKNNIPTRIFGNMNHCRNNSSTGIRRRTVSKEQTNSRISFKHSDLNMNDQLQQTVGKESFVKRSPLIKNNVYILK